MAVVNKFNVNRQQVTLNADIIENMSANDVSYNSSLQYDENTVGDKLSELEKEVIYDVTANNDGATFSSLSALLSDEKLSTIIPTSVRHGGMSIRFIQSSDNKYVQYRLMADTFSTTESDWQGVDDEPTAGSANLVRSGGVYKMNVSVCGYEEENTLDTVAGSNYTNILYLKKTILPIPPGSNVRIYLEGTDGTFNSYCILTSDGFSSKSILINKSVKVTTTGYLTYIQVKIDAENVLLNADTKLKIVIFSSLSNKVDEIETAFNSYTQRANNSYNVFNTRGYINFDNTNGKLVLSDTIYFLRDKAFLYITSGQYDIDLSIHNSSYIALVIDLNNSLVFKTIASLSSTDLIIATVIRNTNTSILKVVNCVIPCKINGKDIQSDITNIQSDITTLDSQIHTKAELGDLYNYKNMAIMPDGTAFKVGYYMCTDFLLIDTSDEIKIKGSQATSMQLCVFYKEDGTKISSYKDILAAKGVTINTGNNVQYTIPTSDIPKDAYYIRCSASISEGGYIKNNGLSLSYLTTELKAQKENITNLNILNKASTLESIWKCREQYLRSLFTNGNESEHWYGVEWTEENNPNNVKAINSIGDNELHTTLPIQSKMRRCVVKDNIVQYYLNADNSELKEDGTAAKLDGTDGNVMVEIPEFFYRFEDEIVDNVRILRIKISEQGLTGFIFSPKRYTSAYEATVDRTTNKFASVCTTNFKRSNQEVTIKNQSNYTEGSGHSLGTKPIAVRNGFTANATNYRGGTNNDTFDNANDPTINLNMDAEYHTFARNQLGIPVANINRTDCRNYADLDNGIFIHQYDTVRILWFLSIIEFKTRNIQNSVLGSGAVKYPDYNAYESFFTPLRGISCIPCGVTNSLGNHSGEVYYKMQDVPVGSTGYGDKIVYSEWNNVWMPCMSYRGIEHFYGHIYKIVDQLTIECAFTGNYVEGHEKNDTWGIYNINYYYTKNPYFCNDKVSQDKLLSSVTFASCIRTISSILGTSQGHILPIKTDENDLGYDYNYCDCCEISNTYGIIYPTFNGRIVSDKLVGSNFIVGADTITLGTTRPSDGTRIDMFI